MFFSEASTEAKHRALIEGTCKPLRTRAVCICGIQGPDSMESVCTLLGQWDLKMLMLPFRNLFMVGEISGAPRKFFWREDSSVWALFTSSALFGVRGGTLVHCAP